MERVFRRTEILLPREAELPRWCVVACDQFSSRPEYWEALEASYRDVPSALHLILPEAFLSRRGGRAERTRIAGTMERYLRSGVFRTLEDSYVYVERTLPSGAVRRGLVGTVDLEQYDYAPGSARPVRATEDTVPERLPTRVALRRQAALETTHVLVFFDDPEDRLLGALERSRGELPELYDTPLPCGGGSIRGFAVSGGAADRADAILDALQDPALLREKYGDLPPVLFAVGDGNHSLAAAKRCWEERRAALSEEERLRDPARYSLVELVNLRDPAISFEPIHRVLFGTDPSAFLREAKEVFTERYRPGETGYTVTAVTAAGSETLALAAAGLGEVIALAEELCRDYAARHGGTLDYVHNDETALAQGQAQSGAALLLPAMRREELLPCIARSGPLPRKSFSIGRAEEKRYYLEARRIR